MGPQCYILYKCGYNTGNKWKIKRNKKHGEAE